jgi:hypothetical protein
MKKISTRVGKQCRKISEQKLTIGLAGDPPTSVLRLQFLAD